MPTHSQPCPSVADKYALDWWGDLTGGFGYYGSSGYDSSGVGGSVLHAQMMRMLVEMKMMMSDHSFQRQLAAPLSLVCHCWTFVVIDDKGGERLIKASGDTCFICLSLYLKTCTAGCSFFCFILVF